ncbi:hypothetical protein EJB05_21988 [Eragrostis curvula]|uniref:MATH domain-containing protein n=1 Tax=Eragrostis curvula TaxID=38414 RepID=A0A5J9V2D0_9POAL|nr:hypothetical protein EJB05_21988 [Eragrostis curvula]
MEPPLPQGLCSKPPTSSEEALQGFTDNGICSSPATVTGVQHQATKEQCSTDAGGGRASPEMEERRIFKWRIDGFSSLLAKGEGWTNSSVFEIKGFKWILAVNLKDRKSADEREYVSIQLVLLPQISVKPDVNIEAKFKFLIYDQMYGNHHGCEFSHSFQIASDSCVLCVTPLNTLKKCSSGFIIGDSCVFGLELINLTTKKANQSSVTVFVQKASAFSTREAVTWDIENFLTLKKCCSPEFEIGGHKWYLSMYPSGSNNSGEFLSVYLHMCQPETSHGSSRVLVELSLSIKDQETSNHKKLTGRCQFSPKEKGDGWGWEKFMSLEEFRDSSKGYLVKGNCWIEADVAIIASSKME